jgi:magnesium chelatase family protein
VLFLDELSEFSRATLDALRQPMEDGRVAIARARHSAVYPARFMLLAATNPCPCGYHGEEGACRCSEAELMRHRRRLSGPLLDRIDILAHLQRPQAPPSPERPPMTSREALELVIGARERQARRLSAEDVELNAHMSARVLAAHVHLDGGADILLACVRDRRLLSARGEARMLRVARTIADLDGSERVRRDDLAAALSLRHQIGSPERCGA